MTAVAAGALAVVFAMAVAGKLSSPSFTRFRSSAAALWPGPGRLRPCPAAALAAGVLRNPVPDPGGRRWRAAGLILVSLEDIVSLFRTPPVRTRQAAR